jgi:hypothetical protein
MSKKGSLNLSINAIVVLILAVTLLSLGLAFITNSFGGATGELDRALKDIGEARRDRVISECNEAACLESSTIKIERTKTETNLLVLNNKLDCAIDVFIDIGGETQEECQILGQEASASKCKGDIKIVTFSPQNVGDRTKVDVPISITPKNNAESTTYRYRVDVHGELDTEKCPDSELSETLYLDIEVE